MALENFFAWIGKMLRQDLPLLNGARNEFEPPLLPLSPDARRTKDAAQALRLLALAEIRDGASRSDAARVGGVGLQTIRDRVLRFNARGPAGLIDGKAPGNVSKLDDAQRQALPHRMLSRTRTPFEAIFSTPMWRPARAASSFKRPVPPTGSR